METIKCVVIGDGAVGKTTLLIARTYKCFSQDYVPTVLDNFATIVDVGSRPLGIGLWDTAGQEDYDKIRQQAYTMRNNPDVALVLFSVVSPSSFENLRTKWVPEIKRLCPACPLILIGTKADLREDAATVQKLKDAHKHPVTSETAQKFAKKVDAVTYIEISSVTQRNVDDLFREVARTHLNRRRGKRPGKICWDNTCVKELGITTKKHKCWKCRINFCSDHAELVPETDKKADKKYVCKKCSGQALLPNPEQTPEEKEKFEATERLEKEKAAKALENQKAKNAEAEKKAIFGDDSSISDSSKSDEHSKPAAAAAADAGKEEKKGVEVSVVGGRGSVVGSEVKKDAPLDAVAATPTAAVVEKKADAEGDKKESKAVETAVAASPVPVIAIAAAPVSTMEKKLEKKKEDDNSTESASARSRSSSASSHSGSEETNDEKRDKQAAANEPAKPVESDKKEPTKAADEPATDVVAASPAVALVAAAPSNGDEKAGMSTETVSARGADTEEMDSALLPTAPVPAAVQGESGNHRRTSSKNKDDKKEGGHREHKAHSSSKHDSTRRRDSDDRAKDPAYKERHRSDHRGSSAGLSGSTARKHASSSGSTVNSPKSSPSSPSASSTRRAHTRTDSARKAEGSGSGSRNGAKRRSDARPSGTVENPATL